MQSPADRPGSRDGIPSWRHLACIVLLLTALGAVADPDAGPGAGAGEAELAPSLRRALADEVAARLAGDDPVTAFRWPAELGHHVLEQPIDSGYGFGASALLCPHYLPALYPEKNLDELCREDFFTSPWLVQRGAYNPNVIARDQVALVAASGRERARRLPLGAAYAYLHRDYDNWPTDTALALLAERRYLAREVAVDLVAPRALSLLPPSVLKVEPREGQVPVDVRVFSHASYDSTTSSERMLVAAAGRGMKAVVVADRGRVDGAQAATRTAQRLQVSGKLPRDFLVIPGQVAYPHAGAVLAVFTTDIIPDGMTTAQTLAEIHRQGGLAYLLHPGVPGGPERLDHFAFDGYLIQPTMFEMFRTLSLTNDPRFAAKPALTGSNSPFGGTVGQPYTLVESEAVTREGIRRGLQARRVSAAGGVYLPWMTVASLPPIARVSRLLSHYFRLHRYAEEHLAGVIGAGSLNLATSWDEELRSMIGLTGLPRGVKRMIDGAPPFRGGPRLDTVFAEYSLLRVGYDRPTDTAFLQATFVW